MRGVVAVLLLASCGRIGFTASPGDDGDVGDDGDAVIGIPDLVAYYPLDDDPATGVITCSDPLANGTCTQPDCPTATAGHVNGAALFALDLVRIDVPTLLGTTPYTVSVWARFDNVLAQSTLLSRPSATDQTSDIFSLGLITESRISFETTPDMMAFAYAIGPAATTDRWYHVAASWDGSDKRLYVDGALVAMETATLVTSSEPIYLGADLDNGLPAYRYEGAIDEVRIYNRALTDGEIALLAAQ